MPDKRQRLCAIPAMDIILNYDWVQDWQAKLGRTRLKREINRELSSVRTRILSDEGFEFSAEEFRNACLSAFADASRPSLRRVINATGVVIHTNLGRSLIAPAAVEAMTQAAQYYSNLEYDLKAGTRGQRISHVGELLCSLTGAEASLVVNNNAGAVMLALSALAKGREVVVSRGELVEIGGSFRIPDIMSLSGAVLTETGTTNRTHLYDYERAITESTAMLLKVHPSNFRIEGFTTAPDRKDLARLARERGLLFMEDAGSGLMVDGEVIGLPHTSDEISIKACLESGADIVTFSGDKMLGGPQIGGIVGRKKYVDLLKRYPMARALRCDKVTLAGFEATLRLYAQGLYDEIPTLRILRLSPETLKSRAESLAENLSQRLTAKIRVLEVNDATGGGSCPEIPLKGWGVSVKHETLGAGQIQRALRGCDVPVLCGAKDDELVLHVRTLQDGEAEILAEALGGVLNA